LEDRSFLIYIFHSLGHRFDFELGSRLSYQPIF
jgi:hypothetical protein